MASNTTLLIPSRPAISSERFQLPSEKAFWRLDRRFAHEAKQVLVLIEKLPEASFEIFDLAGGDEIQRPFPVFGKKIAQREEMLIECSMGQFYDFLPLTVPNERSETI